MRNALNFKLGIAIMACLAAIASTAVAFEGRINAVVTQGPETSTLLYTVGSDQLRIEVTSTNWPHPVNILELKSGAVTLVFPHNRSFVRLWGAHAPSRVPADAPSAGVGREARPTAPGAGALPSSIPGLPPGIGPQSNPQPGAPRMAAMPPMPMMPVPPTERAEFKATGELTNILGFACEQYEIKQRGETLDIWATDQLLPYQPYVRNQGHRFGPRMIEEQWPKPLTERKLFPLLVSLHYDNGAERFRFEVKSVAPEKIAEAKLFQPPPDYHEIEALPF